MQPEVVRCRTPGCENEALKIMFGDVVVHGMCIPCSEKSVAAQQEAEESAWRATISMKYRGSLPARMFDWTLENLAEDAHGLWEQTQEWLSGYMVGERRNLILSGPVGVGKTYVAVSLGHELVACGVHTEFVNWRDALAELRESFTDPRVRPDFRRLYGVPVLVLDDLGAERATSWAADALATLVEKRYGARLPLIVTTNFQMKEVAERLGHEDPVVGQRIVSRLMEDAIGVVAQGRDRRRWRRSA